MEAPVVTRLVGVYDADGTVWGEISYVIGARLGRQHCSLCDITHGALRERAEWKDCRSSLPVAFDVFHRNDQPDEVRKLLAGTHPAVVAETTAGWTLLLGPDELARCDSSPAALVAALEAAVQGLPLRWG